MDGRAVFRRAVEMLSEVTREALDAAGLGLEDVDLFVYHQANGRILRAVGTELGLDADRVVDVIPRFGNTSAATLPIALSVADEEGRLAPGATVLLAAFGAGLVWGGGVVRWGVRPHR
jgi:3-oxoacyl-[acyl-carrier-protein] synthase-3